MFRTAASTKLNAKKQKGKGSAVRGGVVLLLLVIMMVGYYYYLSNKANQSESKIPKMTVAQELISRDLENNYPPTPKEVVKYYSDITRCYYNEEYSKEELEQLAMNARILYDDELSANNDWSKYIMDLQSDITDYEDKSIRISNYSISASTDVDYFSEDGFDFARLHCIYTLSNGSTKQPVDEVYLLRKDDNGHWRIYGWNLANNVTLEQ
ncbi:MAG TPA: DUF6715 family protein [Lachnospiraceae bacterium]|nr:DUF6715 family protein [Lachnospiraceae bacterium]